jgi:hypothetical protein
MSPLDICTIFTARSFRPAWLAGNDRMWSWWSDYLLLSVHPWILYFVACDSSVECERVLCVIRIDSILT